MVSDSFWLSSTFVDLIILGVVFTSASLSYGRRFTGEFCSLLNWLGALILLYLTYPYWGKIFGELFDGRNISFLIVVGAFFLFVFAGLYVVTKMLAKMLQKYVGHKIDCSLGLIYGLLRGVVIACLILGFIKAFGPSTQLLQQINESFSAPYIFTLTELTLDFLQGTAWGSKIL